MSEVLSIEEIKALYPLEWVLVSDPETEENLLVRKGKVLWHGKDKGELHRAIRSLPTPWNLAVLYNGPAVPEGTIAVL